MRPHRIRRVPGYRVRVRNAIVTTTCGPVPEGVPWKPCDTLNFSGSKKCGHRNGITERWVERLLNVIDLAVQS